MESKTTEFSFNDEDGRISYQAFALVSGTIRYGMLAEMIKCYFLLSESSKKRRHSFGNDNMKVFLDSKYMNR